MGDAKTVMAALSDLSGEAMIIFQESKKDDSVDSDSDGKKDAQEISSTELRAAKRNLFFVK